MAVLAYVHLIHGIAAKAATPEANPEDVLSYPI